MAEFNPDAFLNETQEMPASTGFNPEAFLKEAEAEEFDRPIAAGLAGAARGLSFGLSDVGLTQTGLVAPETLKKLEEYNPTASTVGEIAGVVAPSLVTGGAGLVGSAVKGAGSAVRGVSALGSLTEAAVLNSFAKEAATTTAKKILQTATATGARGAIEGAFYGAGQVVSEAALGDKDLNAEKILSTIGLSSLLGGGVGAGLSVAGSGIKAAVKAIAPEIKDLGSTLSGVSRESLETLKKSSDKIDEVVGYGATKDESLSKLAQQISAPYEQARRDYMTNLGSKIDEVIQKSSDSKIVIPQAFDDASKKAGIKNWADIFEEHRQRLLKGSKTAVGEVSDDVQRIGSLETELKQWMKSQNGLAFDSPAEFADLALTPRDLNALKTMYGNSASWDPSRKVSAPINDLYKELTRNADQIFERKVTPEVKQLNKGFKSIYSAEEELSKFGFRTRGHDPESLLKLVYGNEKQWVAAKPHLETVDKLLGTDFVNQIKVGRAVNELYAKGGLSKSFTGRALLIPGLAALAASPIGVTGAAVAGLAGAALQTPAGSRAIAESSVMLGKALQPLADKLVSLGGRANQHVPANLVPWLSAHVAALSQLKSKVDKYDREVKASVNAILDSKATKDFNMESVGLMPSRMTKDDIRSLEKMAERYAGLSNPAELADVVDKSLSEVSLVAPDLSKSLAANLTLQAAFLASKAPKNPYSPTSSYYADWKPSEVDLAKFARYVAATERPISVLKELKANRTPVEGIEVLKNVYPRTYNQIRATFLDKLSDKKTKFSYSKRLQISQLFDIDLDPSISPSSIRFYQSTLPSENMNNDRNGASQNAMGGVSIRTTAATPTKAQQIEAR